MTKVRMVEKCFTYSISRTSFKTCRKRVAIRYLREACDGVEVFGIRQRQGQSFEKERDSSFTAYGEKISKTKVLCQKLC